jgi:hypothetical protein
MIASREDNTPADTGAGRADGNAIKAGHANSGIINRAI